MSWLSVFLFCAVRRVLNVILTGCGDKSITLVRACVRLCEDHLKGDVLSLQLPPLLPSIHCSATEKHCERKQSFLGTLQTSTHLIV